MLEELITSVSSFGKKHTLWVEMKRSFGLKSDDMLASCLLNATERLSQNRFE